MRGTQKTTACSIERGDYMSVGDKAVLLSIKPRWVSMIAAGKKTVEVRKTRPNASLPLKCYIYCTKGQTPVLLALQNLEESPLVMTCGTGTRRYPVEDTSWARLLNGTVCGEFVCDSIETHDLPYPAYQSEVPSALLENAGLSYTDLHRYVGSGGRFYGWHIADLKIYDEPKELGEFYRWWNGVDDIRPCQNGKGCQHIVYDYSENCQACAIDFDGTDCPYLKVTRPPRNWCYVEELP